MQTTSAAGLALVVLLGCSDSTRSEPDRDITPNGLRIHGVTDTTVIDRSQGGQAAVVFTLTNTTNSTIAVDFADSCQVHASVRDARGREHYPDERSICGPSSVRVFGPGESVTGMVIHFGSFVLEGSDLKRRDLAAGPYRITVWLNLADDLPYRVAASPITVTIVE